MKLRWARSVTKHRISKARSRYVIEHSGGRFRLPATRAEDDDRLLYVGDDSNGVALEVMAIELSKDELFVIHAMVLRPKYQPYYEDAKKWRI